MPHVQPEIQQRRRDELHDASLPQNFGHLDDAAHALLQLRRARHEGLSAATRALEKRQRRKLGENGGRVGAGGVIFSGVRGVEVEESLRGLGRVRGRAEVVLCLSGEEGVGGVWMRCGEAENRKERFTVVMLGPGTNSPDSDSGDANR